ncbi:MAG TPA: cell wall-binding repeat-containing protein [Acidimicrobiales bacterium]|nr:cell wall-binding repeat-containing protein [Acidimicrobiales bacterium]
MAAVVGTALAASVLVAGPPASAVADVRSERVAGTDRFATAAEVAEAAFPDGADTVLVASGRAFPDALAGAALGLPVLLTEPGSLPNATVAALDALDATDAIILGGTAAVSSAVAAELAEHVDVVRLAGTNRYETAARIAAAVGPNQVNSIDGLRTAIIATGLNFADALAGGPIASGADGAGVFPVLLVDTGVPAATEDALEALDIEQVIILGGTAAVGNNVKTRLEAITGNPAVRLAGVNRYATAVEIADYAIDELGFPGEEVLLANGVVFADALAGGPLGGVRRAPILLTPASPLASETKGFLEDRSDTIEAITTLGGTAAVSNSTAAAAETAAESGDGGTGRANEAYEVTPQDAASQANGSSRTYTVAVDVPVDIVLVECIDVSTASNQNTQFVNANVNNIADGTASSASGDNNPDLADTPAAISSVNGTPRPTTGPGVNNDYANNISPSNGTVTFVVSGPAGSSTASACVVPVVFRDANQDNALNVSPATNPAVPSEDFGTGGEVTFSPGAAGSGPIGTAANGVNVDRTFKSTDAFVGCVIVDQSAQEFVDDGDCATYRYDSNDDFQIGGQPVTMAAFEAALTPDDDVKGTYAADPAGRSTFNLIDEAPFAPSSPSAVSQAAGNVVIEFGPSDQVANEPGDGYRLYRRARATAGESCTTPAGLTGYGFITATYTDASTTLPPSSRLRMTDTTAAQGAFYCYRVVGVDDFDEGIPSAAVAVTVGASTPTIIPGGAKAESADSTLNSGDVHELKFNQAMHRDSAIGGSYTVQSSTLGAQTIRCGGTLANAACGLSSNRDTMRIRIISGAVAPLSYPLTITDMDGITSAGGTDAVLTGSDVTLEIAAIGETGGPLITTATLTDATGPTNFGAVGDQLTLTFDEDVNHMVASAAAVTETEFEAITGRSVEYNDGTVMTLTVVGARTLRFEVTGQNLASGIAVHTTTTPSRVPGSDNPYVADLPGNPQRPNPSPAPLELAS